MFLVCSKRWTQLYTIDALNWLQGSVKFFLPARLNDFFPLSIYEYFLSKLNYRKLLIITSIAKQSFTHLISVKFQEISEPRSNP